MSNSNQLGPPQTDASARDDSLYRYVMDTAAAVERGPWYLWPTFLVVREATQSDTPGCRDAAESE